MPLYSLREYSGFENNDNNNKDHIYIGKLVQQNEFASINQGPVGLIPRM